MKGIGKEFICTYISCNLANSCDVETDLCIQIQLGVPHGPQVRRLSSANGPTSCRHMCPLVDKNSDLSCMYEVSLVGGSCCSGAGMRKGGDLFGLLRRPRRFSCMPPSPQRDSELHGCNGVVLAKALSSMKGGCVSWLGSCMCRKFHVHPCSRLKQTKRQGPSSAHFRNLDNAVWVKTMPDPLVR